MDFKIAVLAGDGIGPEISVQGVDVMTAVCEKFGHKVDYKYALCGAHAIDEVGDPFPEETYQICKDADAVLFSAVGDPKLTMTRPQRYVRKQGLLAMRKKLGLFCQYSSGTDLQVSGAQISVESRTGRRCRFSLYPRTDRRYVFRRKIPG